MTGARPHCSSCWNGPGPGIPADRGQRRFPLEVAPESRTGWAAVKSFGKLGSLALGGRPTSPPPRRPKTAGRLRFSGWISSAPPRWARVPGLPDHRSEGSPDRQSAGQGKPLLGSPSTPRARWPGLNPFLFPSGERWVCSMPRRTVRQWRGSGWLPPLPDHRTRTGTI